MLYYGTGLLRLPIGTTGQVLTVVGGVPTWSTGAGGVWQPSGVDIYYSAGRVSIASPTNPGYTFYVNGSTRVDGSVVMNADGGSYYLRPLAADQIALIRLADATGLTAFNFATAWSGTRLGQAVVRAYGPEAAGWSAYSSMTHDGTVAQFGSASGALAFLPAAVERMRLTTGGNLLVGTSTDNSYGKLAIDGDISAGGYGSQRAIWSRSTDNTVRAQLFSTTSASYFGTFTNHSLIFRTNDTDRLTINASGKVGIGAAPDDAQGALLQIVGSPILSRGSVGTAYDSYQIRKMSAISPANIAYTFSHRDNDKDLWLYSYNGTDWKNWIKINHDSNSIDLLGTVSATTFSGALTGNASTASALAGQYIDWSAGSGGASIANKPTLGALAAGAWPGAGVVNSTGSAWGSSYGVGISALNLVQLNGSAELPAVSAANLTNFPTLNQSTTGNAATATALAANGTNCSAGMAARGVDASGNAEDCFSASSGTPNYSQAFSSQTSVSLTHNLGTLNVIVACYDGSDVQVGYNTFTVNSTTAATVTFASAQTGRCVVNGTGGGGGGGGGTWGSITGTLGDQTDLASALSGKAA